MKGHFSKEDEGRSREQQPSRGKRFRAAAVPLSSGAAPSDSPYAASAHAKAKGPARPRAFMTDVKRTITGNLKRFISLFVITALGATMLVGLKAACDDLRATADSYYDEQRLFDIAVRSTLGLDQDDVDALARVEGVAESEGGYSETAYTDIDGSREKVDVKALSAKGLNEPRLVDGRLPRDTHEVAVTQKFLDASGKRIGDTVSFESLEKGDDDGSSSASDEDAQIFERGDYTITGSVLDPMDVNAGSKTMSFRSSGGAKYAFFLTPNDVLDRDTFTVAYLTVAGAAELPTYSDEYDRVVDEVKQRLEGVREESERARTDRVKGDANKKIDKEQAKADEKIADAEGQLDDAQAQIDEALAKVAKGKAELDAKGADAKSQLAAAQAQLDASREQLKAGQATIDAKQAELDEGREQAQAALDKIEEAERSAKTLATLMGDAWPAGAWARLQAGDAGARGEFVAGVQDYAADAAGMVDEAQGLLASIDGLLGKLPNDPAVQSEILEKLDRLAALLTAVYPEYADEIALVQELVAGYVGDPETVESAHAVIGQVSGALTSLEGQIKTASANAGGLADAVLAKPQATAALSQIEDGQHQLDAARAQAQEGMAALAAAQAQVDAQAAAAEQQLEAGRKQLEDGSVQATTGQAEIDKGRAELADQKADAQAEFAQARKDVDGIEAATWYIQDRTSLASYASVESDASSIESIATVFPLIFFTVAVLISLTTVTRMVEEDRGLIGVYKALGYSRGRILSKYLIYSFAACLAGGIAGDLLGFIVLPKIIFTIFKTMYSLPAFQLHFNLVSALAGIALFAVGIVGATFLACRHVLKETPASLMRPKAPRAGKRILLERLGPVWRRMSFLNKVSARNLFRYKKRFLMTVFGIAGCTALMICGLGIRDTVISLKPRQYGQEGIVRYDLMAVCADADFAEAERELRGTGAVDTMLPARVDTVTAEFNGIKESVQVVVVPRGSDLSAYLKTPDGTNTSPLVPARDDGRQLGLPAVGNGVLITKNAEQVLGFGLGDTLALQDTELHEGAVRVDGITVNYLGNFIFMTEDAYRAAFDRDPAPNAFLANLTGDDADKIAVADKLAAGDIFVSVSSSTKIANDFSESFKIIDVVVYVVTVMAGALAFAVVFTLSNTNISERERELATIKVLGFRRREVYRYINKETIILTLIGIVVGWPMGYAITRFLTYVLRMPSLFFDTIVAPETYLIASVASLVFTLIINKFTDRSLDRIDMVGALKSAE